MSNVRPESVERIPTEALVTEIRTVLQNARNNAARQVNSELLAAYWNIGRIICEHEQTSPTAPITENGRSKNSPAR